MIDNKFDNGKNIDKKDLKKYFNIKNNKRQNYIGRANNTKQVAKNSNIFHAAFNK